MADERKKTGRPLLAIDENQVYRLAKSGCTDTEIAEHFGCAHTTIERRFAHVLTKARATTKQRLRRKQLELALKGDKTMLIWLGKQMLGQKEPPSVAIQNNVNHTAAAETVKRTKEEDEAFLRLAEKVRRQMKPPGQDLLGGGRD